MDKIKRHTFRGRAYPIRIAPLPPPFKGNAIATCDGPPSAKHKEITIDPDADGLELMRAAIDEGIHACVWDFDNVAVNEMADCISKFLWRLGFRETVSKGGVRTIPPQTGIDSRRGKE